MTARLARARAVVARLARRVGPPPGGAPVWLSGTALVVSTVALVVALTASGSPELPAGAVGRVGPTVDIDPRTASPSPVGALPPGSATGVAPTTGPVDGAAAAAVDCPPATVTVSDAGSLSAALADATPGTSIGLADAVYEDTFVAATPGTEAEPIVLCGGPGAVLDGGDVKGGYVLHLDGASHWRVLGLTVRNGQKGIMADRVRGVELRGLTVEQIGDEAIHLRNFSSDNVVADNVVRDTGLRRDKFGEGIYIGTAESNWCTVTACKPDNSDRNIIRGNRISATTAEAVDIKEGTTGGVVEDNTFDGARLSGSHADSWVDVKGNGWTIRRNTGRRALEDGFQTHEVVDGWGRNNVFSGNTAQVDGPGYGFHFAPVENNRVTCDNKVTGAAKGFANVDCA